MEEVYDLHQHTFLLAIYIQKTKVCFKFYSTTEQKPTYSNGSIEKDTCIVYDKQKTNIKCWGYNYLKTYDEDVKYEDDWDEEDGNEFEEDDVRIDNFRDELYRVFKKDKDEWNEDDLFLLKAISDFIRLSVEDLLEKQYSKLKSADQLHYVFVVPSEWEEEIRETLLRRIFVESNLISKNDHNDRILFCSDLESIFYQLMEDKKFDFEKIRKAIFCRFVSVSEDEMSIKLDLVSTVNRLFDFPKSLLYPKAERSDRLSLTINTFTDGIRAFIKDELPLSIQEEIVQIIMDKKDGPYKEEYLKKPLFTDTSRWELDKNQLDFIRRICIFDICSQVCENTTNNLDLLLSNDIIKYYNILSYVDVLSNEIRPNINLLNWSKCLLVYNQIYSRNKNITLTNRSFGGEIHPDDISQGAYRYGLDTIKNANIYCRPRILPIKNSATFSSIFQESKPDAVMNIDISIESTILSFSLLDENGFVKEIRNHNNFLKDKSVWSLGSFFSFSETTTLHVKSSFITFANDYLMGDDSFFSRNKKNFLLRFIEFAKDYLMDDFFFLSGDKNKSFLKLNVTKIETILCKNSNTKNLLVSTEQKIYIKSFLLFYMAYIKYIISSTLSDIIDSSTEIKIGYNITVEKILLDRLFGTKEDLKDIIYASGLIQKDDSSKKLRIVTEGERIMHLLQRSFALQFPLKSYFALARLHENYIQLTLHHVVTESSSDEEDPEAIIIHDKIIHIPNIYTSLCLNMWTNIVEDNSLIKLCDKHQEYSSDDVLEIYLLENQAEFTKNLKQYISKNNLANNSSQPVTDEINIRLSVSCNCSVYLTVCDIIDISFQPVLQEIESLVSACFINKELFGNFWNIQYLFQLIQFDYNSQLHHSLIRMLKETTEDVMIEKGVDIPHYVIPRSRNQLLQPVINQQPVSYKEFKIGTLHQVHGDSYGVRFKESYKRLGLKVKSKTTDTKAVSMNEETVLLLFKRGDIINNLSSTFTFYLNTPKEVSIFIEYFKLKMLFDLNSDGTVRFGDVQETLIGPYFNELSYDFEIGRDIPFLITVLYEAYSGSLILRANLVGQDIGINKPEILGIPMYLSRF